MSRFAALQPPSILMDGWWCARNAPKKNPRTTLRREKKQTNRKSPGRAARWFVPGQKVLLVRNESGRLHPLTNQRMQFCASPSKLHIYT